MANLSSSTTIANYTRNIKAFYSHLHNERIISKNPVKDVKNVKPKRTMKVMLEDNELKQFFRAFDVSKFDQYRDWIIARNRANAILLRETKNNKQRFVYFSDKIRRHLKAWLDL